MRKRIQAEREMTLKFDEVENLCKLESVTAALPEDPRYPAWVEGIAYMIDRVSTVTV